MISGLTFGRKFVFLGLKFGAPENHKQTSDVSIHRCALYNARGKTSETSLSLPGCSWPIQEHRSPQVTDCLSVLWTSLQNGKNGYVLSGIGTDRPADGGQPHLTVRAAGTPGPVGRVRGGRSSLAVHVVT